MAKHIILTAPAGWEKTNLISHLSSFFHVPNIIFQNHEQVLREMVSNYEFLYFIVDEVPTQNEIVKLIDFIEEKWSDVRVVFVTQSTIKDLPENRNYLFDIVSFQKQA